MGKIIWILILCIGCFIKDRPKEYINQTAQEDNTVQTYSKSFNDSLYAINFDNYQNLPLKDLLNNPTFKKFDDFYAAFDPTTDCIYSLKFFFKKEGTARVQVYLQEFQEVCERQLQKFNFSEVSSFSNIKIRKVWIDHPRIYKIVRTGVDGLSLEDSLKRIDILSYQGKAINQLLEETIIGKYSKFNFFYDRSGCLMAIEIKLIKNKSSTPEVWIVLENFDYIYMKKCLDLKNEHWNMNNVLKEKIRDIKFYYLD